MKDIPGYGGNPFLLELAEKLRKEWRAGEPIELSPALHNMIMLLEEMAIKNRCVYSLFDFEDYTYLFHTSNLFSLIGLDKEATAKWDHGYLSLIEDHKPVEKFLSVRKEIIEMFPDCDMKNFQSVTCGCYAVNLKGERIRGLYCSRPVSFNHSGQVKICFDSVSNVKNLMLPEPGYWMRFTFENHTFHWHSHTSRLVEKDLISRREAELINLWKSGLSIPEIAGRIHISNFTVKNQLSNARKRLLARDNTSLATLCSLAGILGTDL